MEIMAFDPGRRNNAQLMVDCQRLGYLGDHFARVVDVTYGQGRFWRDIVPAQFRAFDLDPSCGVNVADFRDLPIADQSVDVVVLDPPYKMNGTSTGEGPAALDAGYGRSDGHVPTDALRQLVHDGIDEAFRVLTPRGWLLLKCQLQQASARVNDQPGWFAAYAEANGFIERDRLHVVTTPRPQPRPQKTARSNYSTLLVLQRRARSNKTAPADPTNPEGNHQ